MEPDDDEHDEEGDDDGDEEAEDGAEVLEAGVEAETTHHPGQPDWPRYKRGQPHILGLDVDVPDLVVAEVHHHGDGEDDDVVQVAMESLLVGGSTNNSSVGDDDIRAGGNQEVAGDAELHRDQDQEHDDLVGGCQQLLPGEEAEEDELDQEA